MTWTNGLRNLNKDKMKHFKLTEFDSPDKPGSGKHMKKDFLVKLDKAREMAEIPFKINSGFRTKEHNKKVGGSKQSSHLAGCAADISITNSKDRIVVVESLIKAGFKRLGIAEYFIHVDNDITKDDAIWLY